MKGRRAARRLALDVLYEAEIRGRPPVEAFLEREHHGWVIPAAEDTLDPPEALLEGDSTSDRLGDRAGKETSDRLGDRDGQEQEVVGYARGLVAGVQEHQAHIDELIVKYAERWGLQRMPVVDRTVLRMATWELLWGEDIPVAVAINEAVELVKALSTDDSGRFVNGVLGRIAEGKSARA
ncbi:MAG: transcription antitermination factor NusB [Actinobacteria bacterium]|nr:transcription antitermination factor NusB [Actinomycetota bacterium]